jgi:hypothetical protein
LFYSPWFSGGIFLGWVFGKNNPAQKNSYDGPVRASGLWPDLDWLGRELENTFEKKITMMTLRASGLWPDWAIFTS